MTNRSPILVVNKPSKTQRTKAAKGKRVRKNASKSRKVKKQMPGWLYKLFMVMVTVGFILIFYYFFIRPYSYRWKPCYGYKAYGVCMPAGYTVHGIDLSHHQGDVNWKQLATAQQGRFPIKFIFMKASEGGDFGDKVFQQNFDSSRIYGFIRGAYHYYNPNNNPFKQADFFIKSVHLTKGDLPPVLDIEKKGKDIDKMRSDIKLWLKKIEMYYGVKPIIYASYKFKTKYLNDSIFNAYPYWIAHYYVDSVKYEGNWNFWQHTDVGTIPGISKKVDLNVYKGSLADLEELSIR